MRKLILILVPILLCCSAFGQDLKKEHNIAEHYVFGDRQMIVGTPCIGYYDGVPVMLNYKYLGNGGDHYVLIEGVCEKQKTWWSVKEGNTALIKLLGGGVQSMTFTEVKTEALKNKISFVLAIIEDFKPQELGISDILFRTSYGVPESIKIHLDEANQILLHKQYLYIMIAANL